MPIDPSIPLSVQPPSFMGPAQMMTLKDLATRMQMNQMALATEERRQRADQELRSVYADPANRDDKDNLTQQGLARVDSISPEYGMQVRKDMAAAAQREAQTKAALARLQDSELSIYTKKNDMLHSGGMAALNAYKDAKSRGVPDGEARSQAQSIYTDQIENLRKSGVFSDEEIRSFPTSFDPQKVEAQTAGMLKAKDYFAEEGRRRTEAQTAKRDEETKRHHFAIEKKGEGSGDASGPTQDTLEMDAWRYLTDGTLPPNMGRGSQGTKQATDIRNRASALAKDMGMSPDEIRFAQLTNKTQVAAIGQLAKAKAQILQFEKTAEANAELALDASKKVWRTGSPWLNKPLQTVRMQGQGDPDVSVFNAANETFVSEYARVMSGGYGAAQTTEGAQTRAHGLLNSAMTQPQYEAVVGQLKREMKNREKAIADQMNEERKALRVGNRGAEKKEAPPAKSSAAQVLDDLLGPAK